MSRQPSPTASGGAGQGANAAPNVPTKQGYISVSLDCRIVKKEKVLGGIVEVALLNCMGDYYVALFKDGELYAFRKTWDDHRIQLEIDMLAWQNNLCECYAWNGTGTEDDPIECLQAKCDWPTINDAIYAIKHYQALADALQTAEEAERLKWLRKGGLCSIA